MSHRPSSACVSQAERHLETGQIARVIARSGTWVYAQNMTTMLYGWIEEQKLDPTTYPGRPDCKHTGGNGYFISNFEVTATKRHVMRLEPSIDCTHGSERFLLAGDIGRVIARKGQWVYLQNMTTALYGWVIEADLP